MKALITKAEAVANDNVKALKVIGAALVILAIVIVFI